MYVYISWFQKKYKKKWISSLMIDFVGLNLCEDVFIVLEKEKKYGGEENSNNDRCDFTYVH